MLTPQENELLCRVGPAAPMGRLLRRYWTPVALSSELVYGKPLRARVLGETFVAFRCDDGEIGVLDEHCPHRGASLVLAHNEGCALRCLYHGWKIDRSGTVLEAPPEPAEHGFAARVRANAYPVHEDAGMVWAYFGPPPAPAPPTFAFTHVGEERRLNAKTRNDCNWVQSLEGAIDSSHSNYLHAGDIGGRPSRDGSPRLAAEDTPYGFRYGAMRTATVDPERNQYVRVTLFVAPFTAIIPLGNLQNVQIFVPIDDEHNYMYNVKFDPSGPIRYVHREGEMGRPELDFGTERHRDNDWLQDRAAMLAGTSFTGIVGIRNQDRAMQESMGPIYDRSKEHLGASDVAVIRMRRRMLDAVRAFSEDGAPPLGRDVALDELYGAEGVLALDQPWQQLLAERAPLVKG